MLAQQFSTIVSYFRTVRRSFSYSQTVFYFIIFSLFLTSTLGLLQLWNKNLMVTVPASGGALHEGIIGTPRFVNPVLAVTDVDRDLVTLVYSGLMRVDKVGKLQTDLALNYSVSPDGLSYTFKLKPTAVFHDGRAVTSSDIRYTVERTQDPVVKSPKRASWDGVSIETPDSQTIVFRLRQPYVSFLESATLGILPAHLWQSVSSELFAFNETNLAAQGSGPYRITKVKKDGAGSPLTYTLQAFDHFSLGEPRLQNLTLHFYQSEEDAVLAFRRQELESIASLSPKLLQTLSLRKETLRQASLPRVFAVFLNQNQNKIFADPAVRKALDVSVEKEKLITQVLAGFGVALAGPLPPGALGYVESNSTPNSSETDRLLQAQALLHKGGWKLNETTRTMERVDKKELQRLRFTLATVNTPELQQAAKLLAEGWKKIGAEVEVKTYELGDFNQNLIRTRKYEALLFGEIVGREPDLFSFWHSSQRNDPGLNIAMYTNLQTDKLLEKLRTEHQPDLRLRLAQEFDATLRKEVPAIFLYSPSFVYALPAKVKGFQMSALVFPSERFLHVNQWYIEEERIWPFFKNYTQ